ncbi:hypothetical protein K504DRAFT_468777 [Pleomassaria siparia CBS 279.74]|uniref:Uncharacterized protein n=1 Tax=Pleomassaria siparia CBS 279.74 TaxID=1314801 RepID=A0A6G1K7D4_9PLEO|nr:hypothetical protein K504DRAFT_468777 [Pleomassaria siparia CBS 279.74]
MVSFAQDRRIRQLVVVVVVVVVVGGEILLSCLGYYFLSIYQHSPSARYLCTKIWRFIPWPS